MHSPRCGDLVHVDVKKLGKIPAGGGWRKVGRSAGGRNARADKSNGELDKYYRPVRGYHFLHTLADEWAYARLYTSDRERCDEFPRWLHTYNYHRGHTALGGQPPATRVPNLSGQYN